MIYMPELHNDRREWHLEKSVSVGHILTTLSVVAASLWYLSSLETRISNVELEQAHQKESIQRVDSQASTALASVASRIESMCLEQKRDMQRLTDKLDAFLAQVRD